MPRGAPEGPSVAAAGAPSTPRQGLVARQAQNDQWWSLLKQTLHSSSLSPNRGLWPPLPRTCSPKDMQHVSTYPVAETPGTPGGDGSHQNVVGERLRLRGEAPVAHPALGPLGRRRPPGPCGFL